MGWVDDRLDELERQAPDDLKGAVEKLREGWDFVTGYYPDPQVLRKHGQGLGDLHARGQQLLAQYNESLLSLRQSWQGNLADLYLPPDASLAEITHDDAPPDHSASTALSANLQLMVGAFDHNTQTHYYFASQFETLRGKQDEARATIIAAITATGVGTLLIVIGVGLLIDAGAITAAAGTIGVILTFVASVLEGLGIGAEWVVATGVFLVILGTTTARLVLPQALPFPAIPWGPGSGTASSALSEDDIQLLLGEYGTGPHAVPESVIRQWGEMGLDFDQANEAAQIYKLGLGLSAEEIARLVLAGLTVAQVYKLWHDFCNLAGLTDLVVDAANAFGPGALNDYSQLPSSSVLGKIWQLVKTATNPSLPFSTRLGAQRLLGVLNKIGINGLGDLINVNENFTTDVGPSDADILFGSDAIEVGGYQKINSIYSQLDKYLRKFGTGNVQVWLEDDGSREVQALLKKLRKKLGNDNVHTISPSDRKCAS